MRRRAHAAPAQDGEEPALEDAHGARDAVVADGRQLLRAHRQRAVQVAEDDVGEVPVADDDERRRVAAKVRADALEPSRLLLAPPQHRQAERALERVGLPVARIVGRAGAVGEHRGATAGWRRRRRRSVAPPPRRAGGASLRRQRVRRRRLALSCGVVFVTKVRGVIGGAARRAQRRKVEAADVAHLQVRHRQRRLPEEHARRDADGGRVPRLRHAAVVSSPRSRPRSSHLTVGWHCEQNS